MAHVVNGPDLAVNVPQEDGNPEFGLRRPGSPRPGPDRRPELVVMLLWAIQFAAFSIDRLLRSPDLEGLDTLVARLLVTVTGAILSLTILAILQRSSRRSFLARSVIAFLLALVAATVHALINIAIFRLLVEPPGGLPLREELLLSLPPLIFFFSWVHLAVAVVLLSLTYSREVVQRDRRLAEVTGQLAMLKQLRPDDSDQPHLWVRNGAKRVRVDIADIDWIAAEGEYVRLHSGDRSWLERTSMADIGRQLEPLGFVRIHRSAIVNSKRVESLGRTSSGAPQVRLRTGRELRVGKAFRAQARALVGDGTAGPAPAERKAPGA